MCPWRNQLKMAVLIKGTFFVSFFIIVLQVKFSVCLTFKKVGTVFVLMTLYLIYLFKIKNHCFKDRFIFLIKIFLSIISKCLNPNTYSHIPALNVLRSLVLLELMTQYHRSLSFLVYIEYSSVCSLSSEPLYVNIQVYQNM